MELSKYTVRQLKEIIQSYNLHYHIPKYSSKTRLELEHIINKIIEFIDGHLMTKNLNNFEINEPKQKPKQIRVKKDKNLKITKQVKIQEPTISPLNTMEQTRKELDEEVAKFNLDAKKLFEEKTRLAKLVYEERKSTGEKFTKSKMDTIRKNVINKNPMLKKIKDDLLQKSDEISSKFNELGKWGIANGLSERQVSPYISNVRMYDIS